MSKYEAFNYDLATYSTGVKTHEALPSQYRRLVSIMTCIIVIMLDIGTNKA